LANQCEETVFLQPLKVQPWRYLINDTEVKDQPFIVRVERLCDLSGHSDSIKFGNQKKGSKKLKENKGEKKSKHTIRTGIDPYYNGEMKEKSSLEMGDQDFEDCQPIVTYFYHQKNQ